MTELPWDEKRALRELWDRSAYDKGFVTNPFAGDAEAGLGLRRTAALLDHLGSPQNDYPVIHVAGSKGKGSTCAMLASILLAAGARVGLHTSPHLHNFRERFIVDGQLIEPGAFGKLTERVFAAMEAVEAKRPELGRATAFEIATAMALEHFRAASCSVAVVEVGMGGTLDATNVVDPAVSVITTLDWEHVAVLGPGMAEIAANKAGIIKPNRPAVSVRQTPIGEEVIVAAAARASAPLLLQNRDWDVRGVWRNFEATGPWGSWRELHLSLAGNHQMVNAGAAVAALWAGRANLSVVDAATVRAGLANVRWPGRFERIARTGQPDIILDGAHTPASSEALAEAINDELPGGGFVAVVGMFSDKEPDALLKALTHRSPDVKIIAVAAPSPRSADPETVASAARKLGLSAWVAVDLTAALAQAAALAGADGIVIVTGSLSVVAAAQTALGLVADG